MSSIPIHAICELISLANQHDRYCWKNVRVKCEFCQLSEKPLYIYAIENRGNLTRSHMFNIDQIHIMLVFINCKLPDNFYGYCRRCLQMPIFTSFIFSFAWKLKLLQVERNFESQNLSTLMCKLFKRSPNKISHFFKQRGMAFLAPTQISLNLSTLYQTHF